MIITNVCKKCASTANSCPSGCTAIGFFSSTTLCTACASGANTCTSITAATGCNDKYFLKSGVCTACPTGSDKCSAAAITRCSNGYFLETTDKVVKCTSCGTGSLTC